MEWVEQFFQDKHRFDDPSMDYLINKLKDIMRTFSNLKPNQPKSLFYLAKFKIRQTLRSRSNRSFNQLEKSKFAQDAIIEREKYFNNYFNLNFE
jgi:hypothetical protein